MAHIPKGHEEFSGSLSSTTSAALRAPPRGSPGVPDPASNTLPSPNKTAFPFSEPLSQAQEEEEEEDLHVEDDASMISRALPSRSKASDHEDSPETPPDPPSLAPLPALEEFLPSPVLSS